jgi:transposase
LLEDMRAEWSDLDRRIGTFDDEFAAQAKADEAARRLATVPGIGPLNATGLAAAFGNGAAFARGRDLAAWLGLVPRQRRFRNGLPGFKTRGIRLILPTVVSAAPARSKNSWNKRRA